eukprot:scpid86224/ scgid23984/ 
MLLLVRATHSKSPMKRRTSFTCTLEDRSGCWCGSAPDRAEPSRYAQLAWPRRRSCPVDCPGQGQELSRHLTSVWCIPMYTILQNSTIIHTCPELASARTLRTTSTKARARYAAYKDKERDNAIYLGTRKPQRQTLTEVFLF